MKDEIKEILDYLKEFAYKCELEEIYLNKKRIIQLLDYITNLQEERKTLYKYTPEKGFRLVGDDNERI